MPYPVPPPAPPPVIQVVPPKEVDSKTALIPVSSEVPEAPAARPVVEAAPDLSRPREQRHPSRTSASRSRRTPAASPTETAAVAPPEAAAPLWSRPAGEERSADPRPSASRWQAVDPQDSETPAPSAQSALVQTANAPSQETQAAPLLDVPLPISQPAQSQSAQSQSAQSRPSNSRSPSQLDPTRRGWTRPPTRLRPRSLSAEPILATSSAALVSPATPTWTDSRSIFINPETLRSLFTAAQTASQAVPGRRPRPTATRRSVSPIAGAMLDCGGEGCDADPGGVAPRANEDAVNTHSPQGASSNVARLQTIPQTIPAQNNWFPALTGLAQAGSVDAGQPGGSDRPSDAPDAGRPLLILPGTPPQTPADPTGVSPTQPPAAPAVPIPVENPAGTGEPLEITADRQDFDNIRQLFVAEGNVVMRFRQAVLRADRVQVNLPNRIAVAEGNVSLVRGEQDIRGDRFVYNFVQGQGNVLNARGEVFLPSADDDFSVALPSDVSAGPVQSPEVTRRGQPTGVGGIEIGVGGGRSGFRAGGGQVNELRRIRFEAEEIDFTPDGWVATNVRLTNDPFSPPELELRSPQVTYTRLDEFRSELRTQNPRLVFDQRVSLPLFRERTIIDRRQRDTFGLGNIGFDGNLGGLFLERTFSLIESPRVRFTVTPRLLVQRIVDTNFDLGDLSNYGLVGRLRVDFSRRTTLRGTAIFDSLDPREFDEEFRGSLRLQQLIGTPLGDHTLSLEYSLRDRLFNGSLGFQNVQSSLGLLLTSPLISLGGGFAISYQAGTQIITADTDRLDLLDVIRDNNRVTLTRYQGSAALGWNRLLWQGQALPRTPTEGMRFTPNPIVPFVALRAGLTGVFSQYSNGDNQSSLTGSVGIRAQLGNFSRNFLDYTLVDLTYARTTLDGASPFLFDRVVDTQTLTAQFVQQLYGPFRIGVITAINLDNGTEIDTAYLLEYSRRTYGIVLWYSPVREAGSLTLRISDFNWGNFQQPFSAPVGTGTVQQGVRRDTN